MLREYLSNIADKFRTYLDTTEPINAQDFAGKVEDVAARYNQLGFTSGREVGYNQGLEEGTEQGKPLGKLELLQDSEYMNAEVSGTAIAVNDVSPIEHSVGCYLTSDIITDFSGIEVSRYGKNLYKPEFRYSDERVNYTDGVLFVPQYGGNTYVCDCVPLYIPQNTWLYYKHTLLLGKDRVVIRLFNSNGENISTDAKTNIECDPAWYLAAYAGYMIDNPANGFSFKVTSNVAYITFGYCGMNSEGGNKYGDLQLELGTTATPYEPFTKQTYQSTADGIVEGVTSISPNMTLLTNNDGVLLNVEYNRDINVVVDDFDKRLAAIETAITNS